MIEFVRGNILETKADILVNPVNCVGVMSKGLALQFKLAYPSNFQAYQIACRHGALRIGKIFTYQLPSGKYIANFPTKDSWKNPSRIEYIESGLVDLVRFTRSNEVNSIALPPLGCGLGGLNWERVKDLIIRAFECESIETFVYEP